MQAASTMDQRVWGPPFWSTIHLAALGYPAKPTTLEQRRYKNFYESLQFVLPCGMCRVHLQQNLQRFPLDESSLANTDTLFRWTVALHNVVNKQLGRPPVDADDARRRYESSAGERRGPLILLMLVVLAAIVVPLMVFFSRRRNVNGGRR